MQINIPFTKKKVSISMEDQYTDDALQLLKKAQETIKKYSSESEDVKSRMVQNEEWYKARHWEQIRNDKFKNDPEPTTAFVLSTIENKHADAMDYYPVANVLPRDERDKDAAKTLSEIIPVELDWNGFRKVYSKCNYDKLKIGVGIYAVLFDPRQSGIGSNVIRRIDPLNFYCDIYVDDINQSEMVFVAELITRDEFKRKYPDANVDNANKLFEPKDYILASKRDTSDMLLIIDAYYKTVDNAGKTMVQLLKFSGEEILYSSEAEGSEFYSCDVYPFVLDVLYYEKGNIFGFGLIDVIKSPQIYIDKLDQIILSNAFAHGRKKHMVRKNSAVKISDLTDPAVNVIEVEGNMDDIYKEIKQDPTDAGIYNHRQSKIEELKETSSANEFSRGETGGGVTAAQAIVALQKASGKTSRAMIADSYEAFSEIVYIYIEHMGQFYDVPRQYRVDDTKEQDGYRFVEFDNSAIKMQQEPSAIDGQPTYRKPVFDFKIVPEKEDPFSQAARNEQMKEYFTAGVFDPNRYLEAKAMLEGSTFDGKEDIERIVSENANINQTLMAAQQAIAENQKLKMIVQQMTGQDLGAKMGA